MKINRMVVLNILSTLILQGISFFTIPIFTRMLGSEQYGLFSVYNSWISIFSCVVGLGVSTSLATAIYEFKGSFYKYRSALLGLGILSGVFICFFAFLFKDAVSKALGYEFSLIVLMLFTSTFQFIINYMQMSFTYEKRADYNMVLSIGASVINISLSLLLIYFWQNENKYEGRVFGYFISYFIVSLVLCYICFRKHRVIWNIRYVKYGLNIGVPIVFHSLSHSLLTQSDRVMMQKMDVGNSTIGIYSLYYSFVSVLGTLLTALNNSWCPFYYDDLQNESWNKLNNKIKNYTEFFSVLAIGFLLVAKEISCILADSSYWAGANIIPILVVSIYFIFMYQFFVNYELFYKKTKIIAMGTCMAAIVNIILNYILIPYYGMYGAAFATTMSYVFLFVVHYFIVKKIISKVCKIKTFYLLAGCLSVMSVCVLYYVFYDLVLLRWMCAVVIGCYELFRLYKRKSIF